MPPAKWQPPRGIRLFDLPNRPDAPKAVQWRVDGKRKTKTFATAEKQIEFARELAGAAKDHGLDAFRLNPDEAREWRAFRAELGADVPLASVLACWRKHGVERTSLTVADAVTAYLAAKAAEGMSAGAQSHYRAVYGRFSAVYGVRDVATIDRAEVVSWADGLEMADWSRRSHLNRVRSLFRWLKVCRHIAEDPCEGIRQIKIVPKEVQLITPEQGAKLFAVNSQPDVPDHRELCGRLALEAFAGIRFDSVAAMTAADIRRDMQGILLPADKIKTRKRRFIQNLPANLWPWIEWSRPESWVMTKRQYLQAKSLAFVRAKVPHPRNCLRKSAATYHLAAFGNAGHTAAMLCHTSLAKLVNDYNGIASAEVAKLWFEITPPKDSPADTLS
jgi:hypothetical protein